LTHLLAERRLLDPELRGGPSEVKLLGDGHEIAEVSQIHWRLPYSSRIEAKASMHWIECQWGATLSFEPQQSFLASVGSDLSYPVAAITKEHTMRLKTILPAKLGFGTAPLGNMFRDLPDAEARATVEAAWNDGIRYLDNAPFYGAGLAELRLGEALAGRARDE
jgi:hypothetical protein